MLNYLSSHAYHYIMKAHFCTFCFGEFQFEGCRTILGMLKLVHELNNGKMKRFGGNL